MAERAGDDDPVLNTARRPVAGKRKPPSGQVKALPPKIAGQQPSHGTASAAMRAVLNDVRFPATRREVLDAAGDRLVPLGDGRTVRLSTVVEKTALAEFPSAAVLVSEANAVWDDIERTARSE